MPIASGSAIAEASIAIRIQPTSTNGETGTAAITKEPTSGTSTPTTSATQTSDPNTRISSTNCFFCGTFAEQQNRCPAESHVEHLAGEPTDDAHRRPR